MTKSLYDEWKKSKALKFESCFYTPIIEAFCQWHSSTDKGRDEKGRIFNAGYEVFIYAFFVGLYRGERRPLSGQTKSFSMQVFRLGDVSEKGTDRKKYTAIQRYIFAALIAKSNIDLVAYDEEKLDTDETVAILMQTFSEYANAGFYAINEKMNEQEDYFLNSENVLEFVCGV